MKFKKLVKLLQELDPTSAPLSLGEVEARTLLFSTPDMEGLTPVQQRFFHLLAEARTEYACRKVDVLSDPKTAQRRAQLEIGNADREHFLVMLLNAKNHIMESQILFSGTIDRSAVFPREVARLALMKGARCVIVAHNHPSQDVTPSREDLTLTQRLAQSLKVLDITFHDHLIVGSEHSCSLRESHPELWS